MKKSIKLSTLHQQVLEERQLNEVKGQGAGDYCVCGCASSSTLDNGSANANGGLRSPGGGKVFIQEVVVRP